MEKVKIKKEAVLLVFLVLVSGCAREEIPEAEESKQPIAKEAIEAYQRNS